ncbi:LysR substrate-binding domain-containing protein [Halomonas sp. HNIBRBA4712]|uniref:LysR substrate-binding domain-containing protein n=1 Tax=Halomonas sp. HNIBRBA4712 TaxID=3373087 RepID=UPI0037463F20
MIRELKTLLAVVKAGTFAGAAHKIGLTQAGVSAQMKRLEEHLGVTLFERQGRASLLTRQGQQVLSQAQELLALYGQLGLARAPGGGERVTVGAIASMQRLMLPTALARFHRAHPQCRTRVLPGLSMALLDQVDTGELDMAVIIRPPFALHSGLRWQTLAREPFRLLVPASMAGHDWRTLLTRYPFIRYERSSFGGRQVERFLREQHCQVQDLCEVDELDAIVALVARKVGVALLPESKALKRWPTGVHAMDLAAPDFYREIGLVHRGVEQSSPPARALAEELVAAASSR